MYLKCIAIGLSALMLSGCGGEEPEAPPPSSRPVKIFVVSGGAADAIRTFPGRVDASQRAELAFRVPGQLQQILVKEGDLVEAGQVLARLDQLIVDGNISRTDYDRMEANYRSSSAALSQAELNLEYTVMTAPFRGRIARRNVENFEDVLARQSIFSLQNVEELEVIIDLPESVVRSIRGDVSEEAEIASSEKTSTVDAKATFEGRDQHVFTLTPKEIATQADAQTQTFRTTFRMEAPTSFTVLPGMTASVQLDLSTLVSEDSIKWVPTRAVQADSGLEARVWVLDPDTMTVSSRAVSIGRLSGRMIEVNDGLEGGEEIVSVGAPYLAEGMRVTRMLASEQAEPRADDPA
jgi:RND family efflux transporter MFP subunit